jgi:hypothetical protein
VTRLGFNLENAAETTDGADAHEYSIKYKLGGFTPQAKWFSTVFFAD